MIEKTKRLAVESASPGYFNRGRLTRGKSERKIGKNEEKNNSNVPTNTQSHPPMTQTHPQTHIQKRWISVDLLWWQVLHSAK